MAVALLEQITTALGQFSSVNRLYELTWDGGEDDLGSGGPSVNSARQLRCGLSDCINPIGALSETVGVWVMLAGNSEYDARCRNQSRVLITLIFQGLDMASTKTGWSSLFLFSVGIVLGAPAVAGDEVAGVRFSPATGVEANLVVRDHVVEVALTGINGGSTETIAIETEKKLNIKLDDYDFDGHKDFSVSHVDDGMGTYEIYQVYRFSPQEKKFVLLAPPCGGEFINLVVEKRSRTLVNSYISNNRYKTCKKKF